MFVNLTWTLSFGWTFPFMREGEVDVMSACIKTTLSSRMAAAPVGHRVPQADAVGAATKPIATAAADRTHTSAPRRARS
jgi:hypothetical protein